MVESDQVLELVEAVKKSGKLKKGTNEATKALERATAKAVIYASDASPKEIVLHIPMLAEEKGIPCFEVPLKADLGVAAGLEVSTAAIAVIELGDGESILKELTSE